MKRFLHSWVAVVATLGMFSAAAAQNDVNPYAEFGSYHSVLLRAGYPTPDGPGTAGFYVEPPEEVARPVLPPSMNRPFNGFGQPANPMATENPSAVGFRQENPATKDNVAAESTNQETPAETAVKEIPAAEPVPLIGGTWGSSGDRFFVEDESGYCGSYTYSGRPVFRPFCGRLRQRTRCTTGECGDEQGPDCKQNANTVIGVRGLIFTRDYESRRSLSEIGSGARLFSTDADHNGMGGVEASVARRTCENRGWEVRYWGLYPGTATASLTGAPVFATNNFLGLDALDHIASGATVFDIFQQGDTQTISRDTDINNIELNVLRNGGCHTTSNGRRGVVEILAGFRWFQFDESLAFGSDSTFGGYPATLTYTSEVDNTLLGFQLGGRSEYSLSNRWKFNLATKGGLYNNRVNARQTIIDNVGAYAEVGSGAYAGDDYEFADTKDDVAFLGELDLGLSFQHSQRARIQIGYRIVGAAGVALADGQIPYDFTDGDEIMRAHSDGALLLQGGYAGFEISR